MASVINAGTDEVLAVKFGGGTSGHSTDLSSANGGINQPVNIRLLRKGSLGCQSIVPKNYQLELFQEAIENNAVIYLGTGLGKTFIIILFLNDPSIAAQIHEGRKAVFLAPTQDLVQQQARYIHKMLPYKVRVYCGRTCITGKHVDKWSDDEWRSQIDEIDILCMTPQIFSNAIVSGFIRWTDFSAIIFDEAHHSYSMKSGDTGHPYGKALDHYKFHSNNKPTEQKPRLIGLTASLINGVPKDFNKLVYGINELERKFDGKCFTSTDGIDTRPTIVVRAYNNTELTEDNDPIVKMFTNYMKEMRAVLGLTDGSRARMLSLGLNPTNEADKKFVDYHERLSLASSGISIKPNSFHKVLHQLIAIRKSGGLWPLANICFQLSKALQKHSKNRCVSDHVRPMYIHFSAMLTEVVKALERFLGSPWRDVLLEYTQPKWLTLLSVLNDEYTALQSGNTDKSTFSCVVFVRSRIEVVTLFNWLFKLSQKFDEYAFIKAGFAIGMAATAASKWACITRRRTVEQSTMLDNFRRGELNVIVTTSVLEEGIDLPVCSTVIRFDPASNFRVYIQSRGRARQPKASFVSLAIESDTLDVTQKLEEFNRHDVNIKAALNNRDIALDKRYIPKSLYTTSEERSINEDENFARPPDLYIDPSTASVIITIYCGRLNRGRPYSSKLVYRKFQPSSNTFQTGLTLPSGCPVRGEILGNIKSSIGLACHSAYIKVIEALFDAGELNERGIPHRVTEDKIDQILDGYKMKPDLSELTGDLGGEEKIGDGEKTTYSYPWKLFQPGVPISRGFASRTYKLFKVVLRPLESQTRDDVRAFLIKPRYGLIVDATTSIDLLPSKLYCHYGQCEIHYECIQETLKLDTFDLHRDYLHFTHRVIQSYWLTFIKLAVFRDHCIFYMVPLTDSGSIDSASLQRALRAQPHRNLEPHDIVRRNRYYETRNDRPQLYLVKRICRELNVQSNMPGRRNCSFYDHALEEYHVILKNQPILEVTPIAKETAKCTPGKRIRTDHETSSIFFPEQFLDFVSDDPSLIYQSQYLPPIIYRMYLDALIGNLDKIFVDETMDRRRVLFKPSEDKPMDCDDSVEEPEDLYEKLVMGPTGALEEEEEEEEEEDDNLVHPDETGSSDDSDGSESSFDDDSSDMESNDEIDSDSESADPGISQGWRRLEESLPRNNHDPIRHQSSYFSQKFLTTHPSYDDTLGQLESRTKSDQDKILLGLIQFELLSSDSVFMGDDGAMDQPGLAVDLSKEPPFRLDRPSSPLCSRKSRRLGLLEALTHRRATETFNLEALENVGDSYLKYCTSVVLFKTFKNIDEGALTNARSRLLSNIHFTHLARRNKLGTFVIANKYDSKLIPGLFGTPVYVKNCLKPKQLADTVESIVGAYLIYCNEFEAVLALDWLGLKLISSDMFLELHEGAVAFARAPGALLSEENEENAQFSQLVASHKKRLARLEQEVLNYKFNDASYLVQALTHSSAPNKITHSYERLEYLGDAILDFLVTITLYHSGMDKSPGQLSSSRSAIVNNCAFAVMAFKYRFNLFLQHANQELMEMLNSVTERMEEEPELGFLDELQFDNVTKLMADIFEAVAGAIYLDAGCSLDQVWRIFYPILKESIDRELISPSKNIITQLYEKYPGRVEFTLGKVMIEGSMDHYVNVTCVIKDGERQYKFEGQGLNVKRAKMRAAELAMQRGPELARPVQQRRGQQRRFGGSARGRAGPSQRRPFRGPR